MQTCYHETACTDKWVWYGYTFDSWFSWRNFLFGERRLEERAKRGLTAPRQRVSRVSWVLMLQAVHSRGRFPHLMRWSFWFCNAASITIMDDPFCCLSAFNSSLCCSWPNLNHIVLSISFSRHNSDPDDACTQKQHIAFASGSTNWEPATRVSFDLLHSSFM